MAYAPSYEIILERLMFLCKNYKKERSVKFVNRQYELHHINSDEKKMLMNVIECNNWWVEREG